MSRLPCSPALWARFSREPFALGFMAGRYLLTARHGEGGLGQAWRNLCGDGGLSRAVLATPEAGVKRLDFGIARLPWPTEAEDAHLARGHGSACHAGPCGARTIVQVPRNPLAGGRRFFT